MGSVDVDDPALGRDGLRYLVRVVGRRQSGTDIEELPYADLGGEKPYGATQKVSAGAGRHRQFGQQGQQPLAGRAVDREMVLASE
jgi:hypothetical protein